MEPHIDILRALLALVFVLGLILSLGFLIRRHGWKMGLPTPKKSNQKRLSLVELMVLDNKNKLVLIRRDDTEHLIMIGAEQSHVIERNITLPETNSL